MIGFWMALGFVVGVLLTAVALMLALGRTFFKKLTEASTDEPQGRRK